MSARTGDPAAHLENFSLPASLRLKSFYYPRVPASVTAPFKLLNNLRLLIDGVLVTVDI